MRRLAVLVLLIAGACSSPPGASPSSTPSRQPVAATQGVTNTPRPTGVAGAGGGSAQASPGTLPKSLAVLVDLFAAKGGYAITLVAADGSVVARTSAQTRSAIADAVELPYVSSSNSRVYYMDGDHDIRYLKADGSSGLATTVSGSATVHAAFAVTPDDARIAVGLLDYSVSPVKLTIYVEDIGGAHHAVIFTSTDKYVWPVVWHSGHLVVAYLGPGAVPFKSKFVNYSGRDLAQYPYGPNPYGGINFHVINPVTAQREVIISGGGASGLLTKAGTAVVQGDGVDWNGQPIFWNSPTDYGSFSASGSLSPDGRIIAACCPQPSTAGHLVLWYPGGTTTILAVNVTSVDWAGWFDGSHLITGFYQRADGTPSVVDISSDSVTVVDAHGIVAAMLPANLDS
ncbi:MAG: hypothetical protein E6J05_15480 [Chloroflexi bacterium]|nr:MAG: hypothetical protein E6J05_15480 [Chloroflexota bacterium]